VIAIVEQVIHAPIPAGYTEIGEVVQKSEANPRRAEALARARKRLASQFEETEQKITLSSLRLRSGLSQAQVADLLGNSQSSYSMIESGKRSDIFHSTFERLVEIFGVSRDQLAEAFKNTQEKIA
jgi:DNA-binding transcriptional regulator YiaG